MCKAFDMPCGEYLIGDKCAQCRRKQQAQNVPQNVFQRGMSLQRRIPVKEIPDCHAEKPCQRGERHPKDSTKRRLPIQDSITLSMLFGFIQEKIKNWLIGQEYSREMITRAFGKFFKTKTKGSIFFKGTGKTYTIPYVHEIKEFILKRIAQ